LGGKKPPRPLEEASSRKFRRGKILDEILENIGEGAIRRATVREFFSGWLEGKKLAKKKGTGERYEKAINEFLASLGDRVNKSIASVTAADIEHFRDVRTEQGGFTFNGKAGFEARSKRVQHGSPAGAHPS
jgi:hypothetical protein